MQTLNRRGFNIGLFLGFAHTASAQTPPSAPAPPAQAPQRTPPITTITRQVNRWLRVFSHMLPVAFLLALLTLPSSGHAWVTHSNNVPASMGSNPPYNAANPLSAAFNDKSFGTRIVRVTGNSGDNILLNGTTNSGQKWPNRICHQYGSNDNAWNADSSLLLLHGCDNRPGILLDGNTFTVLKVGDVGGFRVWDRNDPDKMYVFSGNTVRAENPRTKESQTLITLSGYSSLQMNGGWQQLADDGRWIAVVAMKGSQKVVFAIDLVNRQKGPDIPAPSNINEGNEAYISATGKYVTIGRGYGGIDKDVYEATTGKLVNSYRGGVGMKHPDTYQLNGRDYLIGIVASTRVVRRDIVTNQESVHMDFGVPNHISTRNVRDRRYAIVSYDSSRSPFPREVMAIRIDGNHKNSFRRLFKHNSARLDQYTNEPHPNVSPDGKKIVFASNWGEGRANAYVALLPDWDTPGQPAGGGTGSSGPVTGPCHLINSGDLPPAGYGAAWNVFRDAKPLLLTSDCQSTSAVLTVGQSASETYHYIYKQGYYYSGGWRPFTLSGSFAQGSQDWLIGQGKYTLQNPPAGITFWVGYMCQWHPDPGVWKCGCRDQACATPYWQLQEFQR